MKIFLFKNRQRLHDNEYVCGLETGNVHVPGWPGGIMGTTSSHGAGSTMWRYVSPRLVVKGQTKYVYCIKSTAEYGQSHLFTFQSSRLAQIDSGTNMQS